MLNKMKPKLQSMKDLHEKILKEINGTSTSPADDISPAKFAELTKQLHDLSLITDKYSEIESQIRDLFSLQQMLDDPLTNEDKDLLEMTQDEIKATTEAIMEGEKELLLAMVPKDLADEGNALLEIRAGTGGDEAGLFAADILRMYERFAERQRWRWEEISKTHDGLGAIKVITHNCCTFNLLILGSVSDHTKPTHSLTFSHFLPKTILSSGRDDSNHRKQRLRPPKIRIRRPSRPTRPRHRNPRSHSHLHNHSRNHAPAHRSSSPDRRL